MVPNPDGVVSSDEEGCPAADNVTVVATSALAVDADSTIAASIPDVVSMNADAPDECQGATFDVSLVLSGAQDQGVG